MKLKQIYIFIACSLVGITLLAQSNNDGTKQGVQKEQQLMGSGHIPLIKSGQFGQSGPVLGYDPSSLYVEAEQGQTVFVKVPFTNKGNDTLVIDFDKSASASSGNGNSLAQHGPFAKTGQTETQNGNPLEHFPTRGNDGDDGFGYYWINSWDKDGPEYKWEEIMFDGEEIFFHGGDNKIDLPFAFPFYDKEYSTIYVGESGIIGVAPDNINSQGNVELPNPNKPNGIIAGFWDKIVQSDGYEGSGSIYYYIKPNCLIVEYSHMIFVDDYAHCSYTFQTILNSNGDIKFNYKQMLGRIGQATIGIESPDGMQGMQIAYKEQFVGNGMSVLIKRPSYIQGTRRGQLVLAPGETKDNVFKINSNGLLPGKYKQQFTITTNDPARAQVSLPFTLYLKGQPASIKLDKNKIGFPATFIGEKDSVEFELYNTTFSPIVLSIYNNNGQFILKDEDVEFELQANSRKEIIAYFVPTSAGNAIGRLVINKQGTNEELGYVVLSAEGRIKPSMMVTGNGIDITLVHGTTYNAQFDIANNGGPGSYLNWKAGFVADYTSKETQFTGIEDTISIDKVVPITQVPRQWLNEFTLDEEGQKLYFISHGVSLDFYEYDLVSNQWAQLSDVPDYDYKVWDRSIIYVNGKVVVMKGTYGPGEFFVYDIKSRTWHTEGNRGMYLAYKELFTDGKSVYIFYDGIDNYSSSFKKYNVTDGSWKDLSLDGLSDLKVGKVRDFTYVNGEFYGTFNYGTPGYNSTGTTSKEKYELVAKYNVGQDKWEQVAIIKNGVNTLLIGENVMVPTSGILYYFNAPNVVTPYNFRTGTWGNRQVFGTGIGYLKEVKKGNDAGFYSLNSLVVNYHKFKPAYFWLDLDKEEGALNSGKSENIQLSVHTNYLDPGTYYCKLGISGDGPGNPETQIPVKVTVVEADGNTRIDNNKDGIVSKQVENKDFGLYPNPAQGSITIINENGEGRNAIYTIVGPRGNIVASGQANYLSTTISTSGLQSGLYILQLKNGPKVARKKFLIK